MTPPGSRPIDLLVAGELNPDVLVSGPDVRPVFGQVETLVEDIRLTIGSSSAIAACGAARLGLRVAFVGVVGDDLFGRAMLEALEGRGVDVGACRVDPDLPTGATVILSRPSDRAILTALGSMVALRGDDLPDALLARARHLHVGSVYLQDRLRTDLPAVFERARRMGTTTSFDPNWDPTGAWDGGLDTLLATADIVLPNREEARRMARRDNDLGAAASLRARGAAEGGRATGPTVAVKLGADGGLATDGATAVRVTAPSVPAVDTTGAGDAFDAGFLAGWLGGRDMAEALRLAVACGALSLRAVGGTEGQATLDEAEALAASLAASALDPGEAVAADLGEAVS